MADRRSRPPRVGEQRVVVAGGGAGRQFLPHQRVERRRRDPASGEAEAREIVRALKYPPLRARSIGGSAPQLGYRTGELPGSTAMLNEQSLTVVMIETRTALSNLREIAAVPGVNVLLIGTNDLCADLGIFGQFGHPNMARAYEDLVAACAEHGKHAGTAGIHDDARLVRHASLGARFMLAGTDINMLLAAASRRSTGLRDALRT